jgi:hypothetical protein
MLILFHIYIKIQIFVITSVPNLSFVWEWQPHEKRLCWAQLFTGIFAVWTASHSGTCNGGYDILEE